MSDGGRAPAVRRTRRLLSKSGRGRGRAPARPRLTARGVGKFILGLCGFVRAGTVILTTQPLSTPESSGLKIGRAEGRETYGAAHASIRGMRRVQTHQLFLPLQQELVALLRGLGESDWSRPTLARRWAIRDVAAHLLDTDLRRLSSQRDGYRPAPPNQVSTDSYQDLVAFINHLNASWVEAAKRLSPRVLVDLLEWSGPRVAELFASLPPDGPAHFPVAWAGEERSANWMDTGREYTEKWHHQAQIREAVGAPGLNSRRWLGPVLELSMYALPHAFRNVQAARGSALTVLIDGDAGGAWHICMEAGGWELREGEAAGAEATVRLDAGTAWRLFFNALDKREAGRRVAAAGDEELCAAFLAVRSVMV
jgi:uncharacterized protein (TIGR03083 family)